MLSVLVCCPCVRTQSTLGGVDVWKLATSLEGGAWHRHGMSQKLLVAIGGGVQAAEPMRCELFAPCAYTAPSNTHAACFIMIEMLPEDSRVFMTQASALCCAAAAFLLISFAASFLALASAGWLLLAAGWMGCAGVVVAM